MHPAKPGIIFGHEYCGEVAAVGEAVDWLKPGDRVIVDPHPPCGCCKNCRSACPGQCTTLYSQQDTPWPEHGVCLLYTSCGLHHLQTGEGAGHDHHCVLPELNRYGVQGLAA